MTLQNDEWYAARNLGKLCTSIKMTRRVGSIIVLLSGIRELNLALRWKEKIAAADRLASGMV